MHENFIQQLQGNGLRGSREVTKEKKKLATLFKRRIEATKKKKKNSEKAMAPHSSTLAWKIPWMEEPGRLESMGSLRVGHD